MNISIVIPVSLSNDKDYANFQRLLEWLQSLYYPDADYEVVVISNWSAVGYGVKIAQTCERLGFRFENYLVCNSLYGAMNVGIEVAKYGQIAFLGWDCIPDVNWLRFGIDALMTYGGIVAGHIELERTDRTIEYFDKNYHHNQARNTINGYAEALNMFIDRDKFYRFGGFPEVQYGGDREWCLKSALPVSYCSEAKIYKAARKTLSAVLGKAWCDTRAVHRVDRNKIYLIPQLWKFGIC